jgi:hypothetical protein
MMGNIEVARLKDLFFTLYFLRAFYFPISSFRKIPTIYHTPTRTYTQMSTWDCPNCFAPCGDVKKLVEHLVSSYLTEKTLAPSGFSKKRKRRPSTTEDEEVDRQSGNEVDYVCPFPRCEHKKQYLSKFNLLQHFFNRK